MSCSKGEAYRTKNKKKCRQRLNTAKHIIELKRTTMCRHQKERIHIATEITLLDNKKCEGTLA